VHTELGDHPHTVLEGVRQLVQCLEGVHVLAELERPTRAVKTLEDGVRVYRGGARYKPVAREARKIGVNRPVDDRAVRFHTRWFLPLDVLPDAERRWPETIPDEVAYDHMAKRGACRCLVCQRPAAEKWKRRYRKLVLGLGS
jgi:hypothetical protein